MKRNNILPGIILIIIGLYFLLRQFNITLPYSDVLLSWPTILFVIGIIQAFQGFSNKDDNKMFTGMILLGLGSYFHSVLTFHYWSYHWGHFTLIVSIAFFMKYFVNKRDGLVPGFILLALSAFALYSAELFSWIRHFQTLWPILLILLGIYFLFFKKR